MLHHEQINYLELPSRDLAATKAFYGSVFGWEFVDFSDDYTAFTSAGMRGGFYISDKVSLTSENGAALIVFYSRDIEATLIKIKKAGGQVIEPFNDFTGGRRINFMDLSGNELSVWTAVDDETTNQ